MSHTSYEALQERIRAAEKLVDVGGRYHHWKDPHTHYTVLHVGFTEWNDELVVIYQNITHDIVWVRRLEGEDGWLTPAQTGTGDTRRFIKVTGEV